jgi:hypothetical protein
VHLSSLAIRGAEYHGALDDPHAWVTAVCGVWGRALEMPGTPADAVAVMERAVARCQAVELKLMLPYALTSLARDCARAGRRADARRALAGAIEASGDLLTRYLGSNAGPFLVEAAWLARGVTAARQLAERGLALAREREYHGVIVKLLRLLGDIEASAGRRRLAGAAARYEEAAPLAARLEMRTEAARIRLGLARVLRVRGQRDAARGHALAAAREFRAMGLAQAAADARTLVTGLAAKLRAP